VVTGAIHRAIEHHAASRPDAAAVVDTHDTLTYRDLNQRANACARRLIEHGFRRGGHATVRMDPGATLAVLLLGVLKAGGCYTWIDARGGAAAEGAALSIAPRGPSAAENYTTLNVVDVLNAEWHASPNLPIVARGSDVACVIPDATGPVMVPHASVLALLNSSTPTPASFGNASSALDLWPVLIAGATAVCAADAAAVAA
jgi:non-ribosomal peptide synthetase component F